MTEQPFSVYLNKPLKVTCKDGREIYGIFVCISAPYSIILQSGVQKILSKIKIDLQVPYSPSFASKPFLLNMTEEVRGSTDKANILKEKIKQETDQTRKFELEKELNIVETLVSEAKQQDQIFMQDKYYIGSLAIPGNQISKIHLLKSN